MSDEGPVLHHIVRFSKMTAPSCCRDLVPVLLPVPVVALPPPPNSPRMFSIMVPVCEVGYLTVILRAWCNIIIAFLIFMTHDIMPGSTVVFRHSHFHYVNKYNHFCIDYRSSDPLSSLQSLLLIDHLIMPPKKASDAPPLPRFGRVGNNLKMGIVGLPNIGKVSFEC